VLLVAGIVAGFMVTGGVWVDLAFARGAGGHSCRMWTIGSQHYHRVPRRLGMGYMEGMKFHSAAEPAPARLSTGLLARGHTVLLAAIGYGGALILAGLMWFKAILERET